MRAIFSIFVLFQWSSLAAAASDSVGFFFSPQKAVVLVKEYGAQSRLQLFMDSFKAETQLVGGNHDKSVRVSCMRNSHEVSCTFGFNPSANAQFGVRRVEARQSLEELNLPAATDVEVGFESSQGDRFILRVNNGHLLMTAHKRGS